MNVPCIECKDLVRCACCNGAGCVNQGCWRLRQCGCTMSRCPGCDGKGRVCRICCPHKQAIPSRTGWSNMTATVALKGYKDDVRGALDRVLDEKLFGAPTIHTRGDQTNREAWVGDWHFNLNERLVENGKGEKITVFRGLAENEEKGVRCHLPSAWIDRIRSVICPEVAGKSE